MGTRSSHWQPGAFISIKTCTTFSAKSERTVSMAADQAADSAYSAAYSAYSAARDQVLGAFAEEVVQVLVEMRAPGCQWLELAPLS